MGNFRFDCYWFILIVLLRGFSFALAVVIGTNVPPAQTTLASLILTTYAILQSWMRPWKVPVINATDMLVNAGLLLLVNKAIQIDADVESQFAETFCIGLLLFLSLENIHESHEHIQSQSFTMLEFLACSRYLHPTRNRQRVGKGLWN